jgi:hypothetical protein
MRLTRTVTTAALSSTATLIAALGLAVVASPPAQAAEHQLVDCAPAVARPCVLAFTRDGVDPGPDYTVSGLAVDDGGDRTVRMTVFEFGTEQGNDLGAAERDHTWSVTLDMGTWEPSIVAGKGRDVEVSRVRVAGGEHRVTITAKPVLLAGQCDQSKVPWRCPEADVVVNDPEYFNNVQWDAIWSMEIYDATSIPEADVRNSIYGLEYFHNFAASTLPPTVRFDGDDVASLIIEIANRRYLDDLSTLVIGHAEMRIPNRFLRMAYGVPDPSTMTGSSLQVTGSGAGAATSIAQEPATDSMRVLIDGVTFPDIGVGDGELRQQAAASSMKTLRVKRGVIKPTKVGVAQTKRVTPGKGRVTAQKAKARGAKITGYQAKCTSGRITVTGKSRTRTVVVKGLKPGRAYQCKVRALSKAGPASYGGKKRLNARP